MSENATIKDTKIDKEFFVSLIHTLLAFIVNIILGAYVIYVSKILQLIELPTDMNKYPYINKPTPTPTSTADSFIGINYLDTKTEDIDTAAAATATTAATTAATAATSTTDSSASNKKPSFIIPRELFFTKICVDLLHEPLYNTNSFFSNIYKNNGTYYVTQIYNRLVIQQIYSFYYWGICTFFKFVNGYDNTITKSESFSIYIWETVMMLVGFPLFILYSIILTIGLLFYIPWIMLSNVLVIWNFDYKSKITSTDDKTSSIFATIWRGILAIYIIFFLLGFSIGWVFLVALPLIGIPVFLPFFIYIFASLIRVKSTIVNTNVNKDSLQYKFGTIIKEIFQLKSDSVNKKSPSYGYNILSFFSIILAIMALGSRNIIGSYGSITPAIIYIIYFIITDAMTLNANKYSITTILLSKLEYITYIIILILILYSSYYGTTVLISVIFIFLALWGLSNKHKLLFYPYIPSEDNTLFIKPNASATIDNSYTISTSSNIQCSGESINFNDILTKIAT